MDRLSMDQLLMNQLGFIGCCSAERGRAADDGRRLLMDRLSMDRLSMNATGECDRCECPILCHTPAPA